MLTFDKTSLTVVLLLGFFGMLEASLCLMNPRCYCSTKKDIKILCKNVTDLTPIEDLLNKYPCIYSLRIYGEKLTKLPSKLFSGKSMIVLEINAPLYNISEDSLTEIHDLQIVNFGGGKFHDVPEAFANTTFRTIELVRGSLTRIEVQFQNNSETTEILLSENLIMDIDPEAFLNATSLQTLNLSKNQISSLVPAVFESLTQLKSIDLSFNLLFSVDGCFKNLNPQEINLYGNNLSSVDKAFHKSMWSVKSLDLGGNPYLNISVSTFDGTMNSLSILSLDDNNFEDFDPLILKNFHSLHRLHLNGNRLSNLPKDFLTSLRTPYLSILELANNNLNSTETLFPLDDSIHKTIPEKRMKLLKLKGNFTDALSSFNHQQSVSPHLKAPSKLKFSDLKVNVPESQSSLGYQRQVIHTLKTVRLDGNRIKFLQFGGTSKSVLHLDLARNEIQKLSATELENLTSVSNLNLSGNPLSEISSSCFRHQLRLKSLDLSFTKLKTLNLSVQNLLNLEDLKVDSSLLIFLEEEELKGLKDLETFSVRNNSLSTVYGALRNLSNLISLDISNNNLTTLTSDSLPLNAEGSVNLKKLWLEGNPWSCDCRLTWLLDWLRIKGSHLEDDPTCRSPSHLNGTRLQSLNLTELQYWKAADCPPECDCNCIPAGSNFFTLVNCSSRHLSNVPKTFPESALKIDLHDNDIESMEGFGLNLYQNLQILDLEDNRLSDVSLSQLPNSFHTLKLAGNNFSRFPYREWNTTAVMTLSRNPWICDCEAWHFGQWMISHNNSVEDLNEVRCANEGIMKNHIIVHLTYEDVCMNLYSSRITVIAVVAVLLSLVCISAFVFRKVLVVLCYSSGCHSLKAEEKHLHSFDAFLLYADEDEEVALGTLAEGLEAEGFKLFIPTRHVFLTSSPINIESSLMECSKVLVLLTKDFLRNDQCMQLLKASMSCSIENTSQRMIFVTEGNDGFLRESDPVLSAVLKNGIQLRRDGFFFWQKLKYHMPRKNRRRIVEDEVTEPLINQGNDG